MGFLDNSGDIILDAVLTDLGRKRLAEGAFSITQFALGDDEINYALYNPNHPSGSAYYDLQIIQTPVLESFTNNTSTMKSRLITLTDNNYLYLPVLKENNLTAQSSRHSSNTFLIAVDSKTQVTRDQDTGTPTGIGRLNGAARDGVLYGFDKHTDGGKIVLDQGIDNTAQVGTLGSVLREDSYIIQIDGRFGTIIHEDGSILNDESGIDVTTDDDGFVFYTVSNTDENSIVSNIGSTVSPIAGSKGTRLSFRVKASQVLIDNQNYFDKFGFALIVDSKSSKVIDTMIRVTGISTGYSIDVPVRFIKDVS